MGRTIVVLLAVAAGAVALASPGCGGDDDPAAANDASVDIVEFRFAPETVEIAAGGEVTFTNGDAAPHTATADDRDAFDTRRLETADVDSITFAETGSYPYFCVFHPFMRGTVEVVE